MESQTGKPSRQARFPGSRRRGHGEYDRREDVLEFLEMPYGMTPGVSLAIISAAVRATMDIEPAHWS